MTFLGVKFGCYVFLLFYFIYIMGDFTKFNKEHENTEKDLVNNISLIVLDDMEKELNEKGISINSEMQKKIKSKDIEVKEISNIKTNRSSKNKRI